MGSYKGWIIIMIRRRRRRRYEEEESCEITVTAAKNITNKKWKTNTLH